MEDNRRFHLWKISKARSRFVPVANYLVTEGRPVLACVGKVAMGKVLRQSPFDGLLQTANRPSLPITSRRDLRCRVPSSGHRAGYESNRAGTRPRASFLPLRVPFWNCGAERISSRFCWCFRLLSLPARETAWNFSTWTKGLLTGVISGTYVPVY